jgi:integrase
MPSRTVTRKRHVPYNAKGCAHIYYSERADGTKVWEVRLPGVKRVYETVGTRLDEAKARARVAWGSANPEPVASIGTRLSEVVEHWRQHRTMRPSSASLLDLVYRVHIEPRFGTTRVRDIDQFAIQTWLGNLERKDGRKGELASGTRRVIYTTMAIILKHAVKMGVIAAVPQIDRKVKPKPSEHRTRILTQDEEQLLLTHADSRPWLQAIITVALHQGLRLGEVCGLMWSDIDFAAGTITVQHNLGRDGKIGPTKGGHIDTIDLMPKAREVLRELRLASGGSNGVVFTNQYGRPRQLRDVQHGFSLSVKRAGLTDGVVFHSLRHTCASRLANSPRIPLVSVRDFMRHTDLATTQGYIHALKDDGRKVRLAEALAGTATA